MSQWPTMFSCFLFLFCPTEIGSQSVTTDPANVVDLLFMVDCSYYVTESNFRTLLMSVANFAETLPIGPSEVHVAALSYSIVVDRTDFTSDKRLAVQGILNLFYDGQAALTHVAFEEAFTVMNSRHSLRPQARRIVILVTESFARYPADSRTSAERLIDSGVEVWAVGVGPYIRQLELLDYTRRLNQTILWDRFDVLPPIKLGLSGSVFTTEMVSATDSATATATPRIQPSTTYSFFSTSENAITPTPTRPATPGTAVTQSITWLSATPTRPATPGTAVTQSITWLSATPTRPATPGTAVTQSITCLSATPTNVATPGTAVTQSITWSSATTTTSAIPTATSNISTISAYNTPSLAPTATDRVSIASLYSTNISLASTATDRVSIASQYSTYMSLAPTATLSDLPMSSAPEIEVPSSTATVSSSVKVDGTGFLSEVVSTTHTTAATKSIDVFRTLNAWSVLEATSLATPATFKTPDTASTDFIMSAQATATAPVVLPTSASWSVIPIYSVYGSLMSSVITKVTSDSIYSPLTPTDVNPSLMPTAINPILTPTAVNPSLAPTAVNPSLAPTAVNPILTPTDIHPSLAPTTVTPTYSSAISLAPTPTQTGWLGPSTTVDDPSDDTPTDDKLGDGSVLFNSSDTDGLCHKAVASKGFGFAPHPSDCDKFLQCHRSETGAVTASVRLCPRGQFWKQANLTCVSSDQSCCQDPCEKKCDGQTFRMDGGCGRYWECWKGVSMARRCPLFHAYIPGTGCVFMPTCVDGDKSTESCHFSGKCESLPLRNNSGYRIQTLSGPFDFTCWASTEFDLASCSCRPQTTLSTCCHLVTLLNMASDAVTNTSAISDAMTQAGCPATQPPDHQASATNCSSGQTAGSDPMRDVTLHFQYLTSNSSPSSLPQVLVRSRACVPERGGILVVSEATSSLDVKVISSTGYVLVASLPLLALNNTTWWDVHVHYTRGDLFLELTAGHLVYSVYSKGGPHIPIGACGWTIGAPEELSDHLSKLTGNITDVLVSRCDEYGF